MTVNDAASISGWLAVVLILGGLAWTWIAGLCSGPIGDMPGWCLLLR